jgi:hypothetical protein
MRTFVPLLLAYVSICLTGCFSVDAAKLDAKSGEEHVVVRNYGWTLFKYIPTVCGNASEDAWLPWSFFRNDITMDKVQKRFFDYARRRGKSATELKYTDYDTVMFNIPIVQYPLPIPYLLCYREIQLSGNLE